MAKSRWTADGGFSLIETLVATTIMTVALSSLAQLFVISTRANQSARTTTFASVMAQQKMEQLRGLAWGFDTIGLPVSDTETDLTVFPEAASGGTGLSPSPADALRSNVEGYVDYLDARGQSLGGGATVHEDATYIRRWSIEPMPTNPNNTLVLQVLVTRRITRGEADTTPGSVRRLPDEARIVSVKTRKAS